MSVDSVQALKSALEESGGTDKLVAVAKQRIMEHKETLRVSTDRVQLLGALAGIEVCKIVVETFTSKGTLH